MSDPFYDSDEWRLRDFLFKQAIERLSAAARPQPFICRPAKPETLEQAVARRRAMLGI